MNKYRLSVMSILIVMVFLYIVGVVNITEKTNFALTLAALIFSISSSIDTFSHENKLEGNVRYILDTLALGIAIVLPQINNIKLVNKMMNTFDSNILLLLALFFTMAGQWSMEIKLIDIKNQKGK
ncbi:MAG: hypothetical protein KIC94_01385 [Clostridiales bacterium]|nr:hypothetical protein [Clostridiales bacterium]